MNQLEFCKTLKFQLSQDRDITMDIWQRTNYAQEVIIPVT